MHAAARPLPAALDASLWRASALAQPASSTVPSGHAALDVELPGAGWPRGSLSELLQVQSGLHEWRLLLPALRVALAAAPQQALVLIGSPHQANLPALACHGIAAGAVLVVEASQPAERLWAAEQALRCRAAAVGAAGPARAVAPLAGGGAGGGAGARAAAGVRLPPLERAA